MTLTAPSCGMGPVLVGDVEYRVKRVPNVKEVKSGIWCLIPPGAAT